MVFFSTLRSVGRKENNYSIKIHDLQDIHKVFGNTITLAPNNASLISLFFFTCVLMLVHVCEDMGICGGQSLTLAVCTLGRAFHMGCGLNQVFMLARPALFQ